MCKLVLITVAATAALAPAAASGQDAWTGMVEVGRPGDPNWAAEAPDQPAPQSASRPWRGPSRPRAAEARPTA